MHIDPSEFRPLSEVADEFDFDISTVKRAANQHAVPLYRIPGSRKVWIRTEDVPKLLRPVAINTPEYTGEDE